MTSLKQNVMQWNFQIVQDEEINKMSSIVSIEWNNTTLMAKRNIPKQYETIYTYLFTKFKEQVLLF